MSGGRRLESGWYASFSVEAAINAFHGVGLELILADRFGRFPGSQPSPRSPLILSAVEGPARGQSA